MLGKEPGLWHTLRNPTCAKANYQGREERASRVLSLTMVQLHACIHLVKLIDISIDGLDPFLIYMYLKRE